MNRDDLAVTASTLAVVASIWSGALPPVATVADTTDTPGTAGAYRHALTTSAAAVVLLAGASRSPAVAVGGGALVALYALTYRQARAA